MYRKRILTYTEIIDYKVYMNCKYRFRVISGSHILHLPVKSVIVGIKIHYIFDISFKSIHCLFLLSLSYGCIIKQVDREFMLNRKKKQTNLAKKGAGKGFLYMRRKKEKMTDRTEQRWKISVRMLFLKSSAIWQIWNHQEKKSGWTMQSHLVMRFWI